MNSRVLPSNELSEVLSLIEEARAERLIPHIIKNSSVKTESFYRAKQLSLRAGLLTFSLTSQQRKLPTGIWYKGGMARNALRQILGMQRYAVRDTDVVAIGNFSEKKLSRLGASVNPDDSSFGHGIEILRTQRDYFSSRDFSCNEIIFNGDRLICTERAVAAIQSKSIALVTKNLTPILLAKSLRLLVVEGDRGASLELMEICRGIAISKFIFNLQCHRAGDSKAKFLEIIKELEISVA